MLQILPIPDNDPFEVLVGVVPLPSEGLLIDDVIVDGFVRELAQVDDPLPALAAEMSAAPNPSRGEVQFSISGVTGAARNNVAHVVSAGVYSYELSTPGAHATKRRIVIR